MSQFHDLSIDLSNKGSLAAIEYARNGNDDRYDSLEEIWADLDKKQENKELNAIADERSNDGQALISVSLKDI